MSIERLTVHEGFLLADPERLPKALGELLLERAQDVERLNPGEYVVTPKVWSKNTHEHELVVLENGEGMYRVRPKDERSGYIQLTADGITGFGRGGREQPINDKSPLIVISGGHPHARGIHIFGLVFYH